MFGQASQPVPQRGSVEHQMIQQFAPEVLESMRGQSQPGQPPEAPGMGNAAPQPAMAGQFAGMMTDQDLVNMQQAAYQSGDMERLRRIEEIQSRRRALVQQPAQPASAPAAAPAPRDTSSGPRNLWDILTGQSPLQDPGMGR